MNGDKWVQATFTSDSPPPTGDGILVRYRKDDLSGFSYSQLVQYANDYDLIVTMPYQSNVAAMNTLRSVNPNIVILCYENVWAIDDRSSEIYTARANNWILKDIYGNEIYAKSWSYNKICDVGNTGYRNWLSNKIQSHMTQYDFDGIMADNTRAIVDSVYGVSADPVNPRTGSVFTRTAWRDAMIGNINAIKSKMGGRTYIGNGLGSLTGSYPNGFWANQALVEPLINVVDGMLIEGFIRWENEGWRSESNWKLDVDYLKYMCEHGKQSVALVNVYGSLTAPESQITMYGLVSYLLGQSGSLSYYSVSGSGIHDMADICQTDVGVPVESYHKRSGSSVYEREYSKSLALVNPTNSYYTISLGGSYRTLGGSWITSITVAPHTGVILLK